MTRAVDLVCPAHRAEIVGSGLWPADYGTCLACRSLSAVVPQEQVIELLPGRDRAHLIATHESGHAIAYLALGIPVRYAVLESSPRVLKGHVELGLPPDSYIPVGLWAGTVAVHRALLEAGEPDEADLIDLANNGYYDSQMLRLTGLSAQALQSARCEAAHIIEERWAAVVRMADRLVERGRIEEDEIAELAELDGCNAV